jgi:hypothetical protein
MTRRGHRSDHATQQREAARIASEHAVRDLQVKESINRLTPGEIAVKLTKKLGTFDVDVINRFDKGEVLSDMYRRGTLQQLGAVVL